MSTIPKIKLVATLFLLTIGDKTFLKGSVYAKKEKEGFRFYSNDPLHPVTSWVSVHNAVDEDGEPFDDFAALEAWVEENVNVELTVVPAPPTTGDFALVSKEGVLSWESQS